MILVIKNKFGLTGASSVKDENKKDLFFVKGSFGGKIANTFKKTVCDANKKPLFIVKNKLLNHVYSVDILNTNKELVLNIKQKPLALTSFEVEGTKEKMTITRSSKPDTIWEIKVGSKLVGRTIRGKMTLLDSFTLEVLDKDDAALLVAIIIAIDNIKDKRNRNTRR